MSRIFLQLLKLFFKPLRPTLRLLCNRQAIHGDATGGPAENASLCAAFVIQ
jgi:hypothetical protein